MGDIMKQKTLKLMVILFIIVIALFPFLSVDEVYASSIMGYDTQGTAGTSSIEGAIYGSRFNCSANGNLETMTVYLDVASGYVGNVKTAIYYSSNSTLLSYSTERTISTDGWHTLNIPATYVVNGTEYVFVVWAEAVVPGTIAVAYDGGITNQGKFKLAETYGTDFPSPISFSNDDNKYSIYATYGETGDYNYRFFGAYNEDTGLMMDEDERGFTATFYYTNRSTQSFLVNGTCWAYVNGDVQSILFEFESGADREYWFDDDDGEDAINDFYVYGSGLTAYYISFLDYTDVLGDYPLVTASRYINGSSTVVEKRVVDVEQKFTMGLQNGKIYTIQVVAEDGTSYTFGDLLMTPSTTVQLTLRGVDFPQSSLIAEDLNYYAIRARDGENITVYYLDGTEETTSVNVTMYYTNLTLAYSTVFANSSFTLVWTSAVNTTDYLVVSEIVHDTYGNMTSRKLLMGAVDSVLWSLDFLGDFDALGFDSYMLIPSLILLCVAGSFSKLNAYVGAILMVVTASFLSAMGWFPIAGGAIVAGFAFAILMAIIYARRGSPS